MRNEIVLSVCFFLSACTNTREGFDMTDRKPDFYIYRGDGNQGILDTIRACWKIGILNAGTNREMLLVRVEPPISPTALSQAAKTDVLGLARRSELFGVDEFAGGGFSDAVVWEVTQAADDSSFVAVRSIGIVVTWRDRPKQQSDPR